MTEATLNAAVIRINRREFRLICTQDFYDYLAEESLVVVQGERKVERS